jgi:hypothetical protein
MHGDGILVHATISVDAHPGEDNDFAIELGENRDT